MSTWAVLERHPSLLVTHLDGAAWLELSRPEALNAFDDELAANLLDVVERLAADSGIRCLVISGSGRAFSAGADVKTQFATGERADLGELLRNVTNPTIRAIREMPKPVLAAVNGPAAGIGCSIAVACDLVIAATSASFLLPFAKLGLSVDGGTSITVAARVGLGRAMRMALLAERVGAEDACSWGLADELVPDGELRSHTERLALQLASGPGRALAAIKTLLHRTALASLGEQLELEASVQSELGSTDDFREGVRAFLEKRTPIFDRGDHRNGRIEP
jgi:2-(1,2-epoxy-1,2-dihydrophenyl)acetyl-CoA isomerase